MEKQTIPSPDDKCINYTCMISMGKLSAVKQVKSCEHQSQSDCGIGYQYQILSEQCCGKCVPTSCVYITPDGKTILLKESENWKSDDSCTTVTCKKINGQFFTSSVTETCTYTSAKDCGLGYIYQTIPNQCCGNCVQKSCVFTTANGVLTTLEDGQTLPEPSDICTVYNCKKTNGQFLTLSVKKTCEHVSARDCKAGEKYQKVPGQCCGQCVQTQCLIIDAGGVNKTLNVGENWTSIRNPCISYGCIKSNGQIYSMLMNKTCQTLTPQECGCGTFQLSADGCCIKCIPPKTCRAVNNITTLREKGCQLQENVPYCDGVCITKPGPMLSSGKEKPCLCCGIQKSNMRTVKLKCPNGKTINYKYEYIEKCGCDNLMCKNTYNIND
ncbi:intestinal mucin-like protein [Lithobates pipiens]